MDVAAYMAERVPSIDAAIEARLASLGDVARGEGVAGAPLGVPARLREAMGHLLFPGGKRLRPVFALAGAEAVGGAPERAMPLAIAVELIHTYSLVHDDLPCMDDDDLRRGRPTVHVAFDEATAVLAGDALLTEAFGALSDLAAEPDGCAAAVRLSVLARLARAAGAAGLVGGQVDDLAFAATGAGGATAAVGVESSSTRVESGTDHARLASIHARKTAALFEASIVGGALLGGASEAQSTRLERFGRDVGIAFQIADDLLDADADEAASILRLAGIDDARAGANALLDRALGEIDGWGEGAEPLRALARFAVRRDR